MQLQGEAVSSDRFLISCWQWFIQRAAIEQEESYENFLLKWFWETVFFCLGLCNGLIISNFWFIKQHKENSNVVWLFSCLHGENYSVLLSQPVSFCSSLWLFCSSLLHTSPPTFPLPCTRVCFPHSAAISPFSPCSCASCSRCSHCCFWSAIPLHLLKSRYPFTPKCPACLSPTCLQVFSNFLLERRREIRQLSRNNQNIPPQLQLRKLWIRWTKTSEEKANNYPDRCWSSPFHNTMAQKRREFPKNLLQRYLCSKRTSYRCAVGDFYTSLLRVSQHPVTSFWYGMKRNWITSDLHDLLKPNRKWAAVSALNPELTPCSASPTQSLFLPVG